MEKTEPKVIDMYKWIIDLDDVSYVPPLYNPDPILGTFCAKGADFMSPEFITMTKMGIEKKEFDMDKAEANLINALYNLEVKIDELDEIVHRIEELLDD